MDCKKNKLFIVTGRERGGRALDKATLLLIDFKPTE